MAKINSREKGSAAEREIAKLLFDHLGVKLVRNLEQSRGGGHDLIPEAGSILQPYAIEVKRYSKVTTAMLQGFWQQACKQAQASYKVPVLMYRQDRADWQCVLPLHCINPNLSKSDDFTSVAFLGIEAFCAVVRG